MDKKSEQIGEVNIDLSYYKGEDLYSEGDAEDTILEIVKNEPASRYNEIIARNMTWNVLYHLSDKRGNIADFIPIHDGHKVLEIGAGCGAVTATLAAKAKSVTSVELSYKRSLINAYRNKNIENLNIIVGNFDDIEPNLTEQYDYIFLIGVLEYAGAYIDTEDPYVEMLERLAGHLAQGGEIVVAIENKFGLKYVAGCREDHSGLFYDGVEGYCKESGSKARTFSKGGLEKLAKQAGLRAEFYYPYPDYKLPSVIFSDQRLPKPGELKDNTRNFDASRFVAFDEAKAFDEAVREGKFQEVSNSFLVFYSKEDRIESFDVTKPLYSKHSDERDARYQIRTDILVDGYHRKYVMKYPKTQAAEAHLLAMYDTSVKMMSKLKDTNVKVNKARLITDWDGDFVGVQFEYLEGRTLADALASQIAEGNKEAALKVIREYSKFVLGKRLPDVDLIFSNILITSDGTWHVTDYEWIEEGASPDFVVYRAIRYFLEEYEGLISAEELYEAAGLDMSLAVEYGIKEDELQHRISGSYVTLDQMYSIFGKGYVTLAQAMEAHKGIMRPGHVKVYADKGEGYTEDGMPFFDAEVDDDMRVSFDIPLPVGTKRLRVDPQEDYCIVRLLKSTVQEGLANGRVCGNTVIFDTPDPQLIFEIPAGLTSFHIEYTLQMTDKAVYDDINAALTAYETTPMGIRATFSKTPREKNEYDKISAVDRAE